MNIDFINHEDVECVKIGMKPGDMLQDNAYLVKLREVFQKYGIRKAWAQGPFFGNRHSGIRFWFEDVEPNLEMESVLDDVVETYEHITGGNQKKCRYFRRPSLSSAIYNREVIYEDGIFYSNGWTGLVQHHNATADMDKSEMVMTIIGLLDTLTEGSSTLYKLQKVYRLSVFLFSKLGHIAYACPEYVDVVYSYMKVLRRTIVTLENKCKEPDMETIKFLEDKALQYLRKDVMEAHER